MNALLTYRRLTETDIPTFVAMRITQLKEEGAQSDLDLEPALTTYYQKHLTDGTFVSWLAVDGERIIGTSGMSFVEKPPYYSNPTGKIGLLSSIVYPSGLPQTGHCLETAGLRGGRGESLRMRRCVDHRIRNGCAVVYCVWIREKRTFFAVCVVMRSEKVLHISKVF